MKINSKLTMFPCFPTSPTLTPFVCHFRRQGCAADNGLNIVLIAFPQKKNKAIKRLQLKSPRACPWYSSCLLCPLQSFVTNPSLWRTSRVRRLTHLTTVGATSLVLLARPLVREFRSAASLLLDLTRPSLQPRPRQDLGHQGRNSSVNRSRA